MRIFMLLGIFIVLSACSLKPWVKPYQRQLLAEPVMVFDNDPLDAGFLEHVYQSREAARGAQNNGGGGCGCN